EAADLAGESAFVQLKRFTPGEYLVHAVRAGDGHPRRHRHAFFHSLRFDEPPERLRTGIAFLTQPPRCLQHVGRAEGEENETTPPGWWGVKPPDGADRGRIGDASSLEVSAPHEHYSMRGKGAPGPCHRARPAAERPGSHAARGNPAADAPRREP